MSRGRSNALENAPPARFSEADESTPWGICSEVGAACERWLTRRGLNRLCACGAKLTAYAWRQCPACREARRAKA